MSSRDHLERLRQLLDEINTYLQTDDPDAGFDALQEASSELDAVLDVFPDKMEA